MLRKLGSCTKDELVQAVERRVTKDEIKKAVDAGCDDDEDEDEDENQQQDQRSGAREQRRAQQDEQQDEGQDDQQDDRQSLSDDEAEKLGAAFLALHGRVDELYEELVGSEPDRRLLSMPA